MLDQSNASRLKKVYNVVHDINVNEDIQSIKFVNDDSYVRLKSKSRTKII